MGKKVRILLTGSSGFIGKNILEALIDRYIFVAPAHQELVLSDDVAVRKFILQKKITHIIHSAVPKVEEYFEEALRINAAIFHQSEIVDQIVYFGTGAEFGKSRNLKKVSEDSFGQFIPQDTNGFSKYLTQLMAKNYKNVINLRLFGVFGNYENYLSKFISNCIVKNLCDLPITINQDAMFDYLSITDLPTVVEYFLFHGCSFGDVNITPTKSYRLSEIAKIVQEITQTPYPIKVLIPGLQPEYTGDNTRLKRLVKGFEDTSLEKAIEDLFVYYKKIKKHLNIEAIKKDLYLARVQKKQ